MTDPIYRGYDFEHRVWRYGWCTQLVEGARRFMAIICEDGEENLTRYYIHYPITITRYTGIKDRNSKKIFEGDHITVFGKEASVYYCDANACFNYQHLSSPYTVERLGSLSSPAFEVIGNKFEYLIKPCEEN